jgi:chromosome segregation ATPase
MVELHKKNEALAQTYSSEKSRAESRLASFENDKSEYADKIMDYELDKKAGKTIDEKKYAAAKEQLENFKSRILKETPILNKTIKDCTQKIANVQKEKANFEKQAKLLAKEANKSTNVLSKKISALTSEIKKQNIAKKRIDSNLTQLTVKKLTANTKQKEILQKQMDDLTLQQEELDKKLGSLMSNKNETSVQKDKLQDTIDYWKQIKKSSKKSN